MVRINNDTYNWSMVHINNSNGTYFPLFIAKKLLTSEFIGKFLKRQLLPSRSNIATMGCDPSYVPHRSDILEHKGEKMDQILMCRVPLS